MTRFKVILLFLLALLSGCSLLHIATRTKSPVVIPPVQITDTTIKLTHIMKADPVDSTNKALLKKYAVLLEMPPDTLTNIKLYKFIEEWQGIPFLQGGTNKNGIDCSAFIQRLLKDVYGLKLPRSSIQQVYTNRVELFKSVKYLGEGDIVFFRTIPNTVVSHVGIYLHNKRFVHSCLSRGVTISSLEEPYYKSRYVAGGRIKADLAKY